jgi:hypothetical protein
MPKKRIHKDRSTGTGIRPKTRNRVECKCMLHCNGSKWVDPRTFERHRQEVERFQAITSEPQSAFQFRSTMNSPIDAGSSSTSKGRSVREAEEESQYLSSSRHSDDDESNQTDDQEPINIPAKRKRYHKFRQPEPIPDDENLDDVNSGSGSEEDEEDEDDFDNDDESDDDRGFSEDDVPIEQFTAPDFDDFDFESDDEYPDSNLESDDSWILLWILKYQARFRLPDVAIDSLIKFFRIVLLDANHERFKNFPTSSYMMRKLLEIGKQSKTYAVCPSCNKLYNISEIRSTSGLKCNHVEFPNHPKRNQRKSCGTEVTKWVRTTSGYIIKPKMVYPLPSLKTQIIAMYRRPGFESLLKKWPNRDSEADLYTDIYDGEIWKTFPSSVDNSAEQQEQQQFFTTNTADSHLGIMINLDWFQPFDSASYSTGAIYGVICNLPREVRFKKENMLILALLPGPDEVKLHKINHYLAPIVDELLEFWSGFDLPQSENHPEGKKIRLAVICCANDIPAARKLCGHISALAGCHRCYKRANIVGRKLNFGGFDDMSEWFQDRDLEEHRTNAEAWRHCKSKDERRNHVSTTLVRWSEMLRLPYFNPIRHLIVDPMHCLFLGIARWIIKRLWIDGGKITKTDLKLMEKRAKEIKLPADMGRIPYKISTGEGFSGFTADQWKSFILIYAIPLMWDLLVTSDRKILANFVKACSLLTCRIIDNNMLGQAHDRLLQVAKLIEENYGPESITPNIHLSLHITDCCKDYGPLYSFWCYSFERMNGLLGKLLIMLIYMKNMLKYFFLLFLIGSYPSSGRNIEPELLRIIQQNCRLDELIVANQSNNLNEVLKLVKSRPTAGSLAMYDGFDSSELHQFRQTFRIESDITITGSEEFPGEMLTPRNDRVSLPDDIYELLVHYYNAAYEWVFVTIAGASDKLYLGEESEDFIVVLPNIIQHGRIRIGSEIFGAKIAPRYRKNSHILAKFIQNNETVDTFPGEVQFFFTHTIVLPTGTKTHQLAFVKWYLPVPDRKTRFYCKADNDDDEGCNVELWMNKCYKADRDSIIPVHNIYSRFVPSKFVVGSRTPKTYMAVTPINRQFYL